MEEKFYDIQELIKVESLPKIFYQLEIIGQEVAKALEGVETMVCNEENKKEEKVIPKVEPKVQEPELPLEETNLYKETADYIKSIVMGLGMSECEIKEMSNEEEIYFELDCGDDYGIIIGKRGETLDAIQYLARMMANKGNQSYKRVAINVGNYRAKREETLQILARKTAMRAVRQGRNISLEPMNPYERRIIHTAVQDVEV